MNNTCGHRHDSGRICILPFGHDGHHEDFERIHWSPACPDRRSNLEQLEAAKQRDSDKVSK